MAGPGAGHFFQGWGVQRVAGSAGLALSVASGEKLPGAAEMGHVRTLFESVKWTTLRPHQEAVSQGSDDPLKFVSCAKTADNSTYVMYFPAGAKAAIKLHIRGGGESGTRWFNPRSGEWSKNDGLTPPDDEDWVLVVKP